MYRNSFCGEHRFAFTYLRTESPIRRIVVLSGMDKFFNTSRGVTSLGAGNAQNETVESDFSLVMVFHFPRVLLPRSLQAGRRTLQWGWCTVVVLFCLLHSCLHHFQVEGSRSAENCTFRLEEHGHCLWSHSTATVLSHLLVDGPQSR